MTNLEKARKIINEADKEMARLFCERMDAVKEVAQYKKSVGMPIFDETRENEVLLRNSEYITNEEYRQYYVNFLKYQMKLSKSYQHKLLDGQRVAFAGMEGAFGNVAANRIFPDGNPVAYPDFAAAYKAVADGECDCAVLPIENSYAGEVTQVMDLAFFGQLYINGVYDLEVNHCLLGVKGAKIDDIDIVVSHPQALAQCAKYIREHNFEQREASNTAVAAGDIAKSCEKNIGAIAGSEAANLYGLEVLAKGINESNTNTTRFAVFSRAQKAQSDSDRHFIMFFTVNNEAGSLGKAVSVIGKYHFNLKALKSRPTKEMNWEYYFFVEGEGNIYGSSGKQMVNELSECCTTLKIAGSFEKETVIKERG